jgi:hypothetical protein
VAPKSVPAGRTAKKWFLICCTAGTTVERVFSMAMNSLDQAVQTREKGLKTVGKNYSVTLF